MPARSLVLAFPSVSTCKAWSNNLGDLAAYAAAAAVVAPNLEATNQLIRLFCRLLALFLFLMLFSSEIQKKGAAQVCLSKKETLLPHLQFY